MYVILLNYKKSFEIVDQYLQAHRDFLSIGYDANAFVVSGPQNPRTGGVIISQLSDRKALEALLNQDPFKIHDIADYEIIEFTPAKFHKDFAHAI